MVDGDFFTKLFRTQAHTLVVINPHHDEMQRYAPNAYNMSQLRSFRLVDYFVKW